MPGKAKKPGRYAAAVRATSRRSGEDLREQFGVVATDLDLDLAYERRRVERKAAMRAEFAKQVAAEVVKLLRKSGHITSR